MNAKREVLCCRADDVHDNDDDDDTTRKMREWADGLTCKQSIASQSVKHICESKREWERDRRTTGKKRNVGKCIVDFISRRFNWNISPTDLGTTRCFTKTIHYLLTVYMFCYIYMCVCVVSLVIWSCLATHKCVCIFFHVCVFRALSYFASFLLVYVFQHFVLYVCASMYFFLASLVCCWWFFRLGLIKYMLL